MPFTVEQLKLINDAIYCYCVELRQTEKEARRWSEVAFANLCDDKATAAKKLYVLIEGLLEGGV